jgi:hypothetical protein
VFTSHPALFASPLGEVHVSSLESAFRRAQEPRRIRLEYWNSAQDFNSGDWPVSARESFAQSNEGRTSRVRVGHGVAMRGGWALDQLHHERGVAAGALELAGSRVSRLIDTAIAAH